MVEEIGNDEGDSEDSDKEEEHANSEDDSGKAVEKESLRFAGHGRGKQVPWISHN